MAKLVLVTRPIEQAKDFTADLNHAGFIPVIQPLLTIEYPPTDLSSFAKPDAIILTSARGVEQVEIPEGWKNIPVLCVGETTADKACHCGFLNMITGHFGVDGLLPLVRKHIPLQSSLLYLCGDVVTVDLEKELGQDYHIQSYVTYHSVPVEKIEDAVLEQFKNLYAITIFSERTGRVLAGFIEKYGLSTQTPHINLLCLSNTVLESVNSFNWASCHVADEPNKKSMIDKLKDIKCQKK